MTTTNPTIFVDRTTTWHAIGKTVDQCKDLNGVLKASGLDYTVEKHPVFAQINGKTTEIPNRFVTARDTDGHPYDVVSDKFEIIQNRDAFDFVNYMGDELQFQKAGETENGMVYIIGALPQVSILGDAFTPHVIFRNGFTGKVKITAAICPPAAGVPEPVQLRLQRGPEHRHHSSRAKRQGQAGGGPGGAEALR